MGRVGGGAAVGAKGGAASEAVSTESKVLRSGLVRTAAADRNGSWLQERGGVGWEDGTVEEQWTAGTGMVHSFQIKMDFLGLLVFERRVVTTALTTAAAWESSPEL